MENKTAIIAGASGLIGGHLLKLLLNEYQSVISVSRRKLEVQHPRLTQKIINFDELHKLENELRGNHVFCTLGSTIKKAGSKEKFYLYDYTYPVELAILALTNGATQFHIVSSVGAKRKSLFFYSRVKGEVEETISKMDYKSIHIYRPSLLLGERNEFRAGEKIGEYISYLFYPFYRLAKNYRPIKAEKVARGMMFMAANDEPGVFYHPSGELQNFQP